MASHNKQLLFQVIATKGRWRANIFALCWSTLSAASNKNLTLQLLVLCKLALVTSLCEFPNLNENSRTWMNFHNLCRNQHWKETCLPSQCTTGVMLVLQHQFWRGGCTVEVQVHLSGWNWSGKFWVFLLDVSASSQHRLRDLLSNRNVTA